VFSDLSRENIRLRRTMMCHMDAIYVNLPEIPRAFLSAVFLFQVQGNTLIETRMEMCSSSCPHFKFYAQKFLIYVNILNICASGVTYIRVNIAYIMT